MRQCAWRSRRKSLRQSCGTVRADAIADDGLPAASVAWVRRYTFARRGHRDSRPPPLMARGDNSSASGRMPQPRRPHMFEVGTSCDFGNPARCTGGCTRTTRGTNRARVGRKLVSGSTRRLNLEPCQSGRKSRHGDRKACPPSSSASGRPPPRTVPVGGAALGLTSPVVKNTIYTRICGRDAVCYNRLAQTNESRYYSSRNIRRPTPPRPNQTCEKGQRVGLEFATGMMSTEM